MARVKRGVAAKKRKKKILKRTKGFLHGRKKLIKQAKEADVKSGKRAYVGRKTRKRTERRLWQIRINAATRAAGTNYSRFINSLKKAKININRKMLAEMAVNEPAALKALIKEVAEKNK
ncbi:50S ribosomal protein L20 [Patescibacteria group bacterium]